MNNALLVRVLYCRTDFLKQVKAFGNSERVGIAVVRERDALHQFHDEVGLAILGGPGVKQSRDVRMVHKRDRLPLGLEPRQDHLRIAAIDPNHFQGHAAFNGFGLVGHPDAPYAPFADLLEQLIPTHHRSAVGSEIPRASAASGIVIPAKNLITTNSALRGSALANVWRASSNARI